MPRKPRAGIDLQVQALSTGEIVGLVDDIGGQPIAQPNARPLLSATEQRRKVSAKQAQADRKIAERKAKHQQIVKAMFNPPLVAPTRAGDRLIGTIGGKALIVHSEGKPWRRL